uniref:Putative replicase n=1 Tax=Pafsystermes virus TaxID=2796624 RepID=A0A894KJW3_9VIRU|nr:putative replicase [Pafsystermes virus]
MGYFAHYSSIGQALGWDGISCRDAGNLEILRRLVRAKISALSTGTVPPADDIRLFIKSEPHSGEKLRQGRFRLISVLSLEDQVVDRYLFSSWSEADLLHVASSPCKAGWSPLPSGFAAFNAAFPGKVLATDCSSFDWTFPEWTAQLLLDLRLQQCMDPPQWYSNAVRARWAQVLRHSVVRLPDGRRFQQQRWGVMKSGWFRTIHENSGAQWLINALAALRADIPLGTIWTMGDDVILEWDDSYDVESFEAQLRQCGILVKRSSHEREFAGFVMGPGLYVRPAYRDKHLFALAYVPPSLASEVADAYACYYHLSGDREIATILAPHVTLTELQRLAWCLGVGL